ncbi:hypothetical protein PLICRDRAFT_180635 [Plicaturopsis crispa FD-325 SS-3]|uniref:Small ribosomal subunit protein uS7 domain-containing protein n=1 Tax=Plicaturopsis crispa FD-325 SS-3 TaxID=944288 RepID=A0A0C9SK72_PLICR|nr:hypothetical protein PLICRDRAFT_180635 [Plicaturopsis crispa FD-325 SS-3]
MSTYIRPVVSKTFARPIPRRAVARWARTLSTAPSSSDNAIVNESLNVLGNITGGGIFAPDALALPPTPVAPSTRPAWQQDEPVLTIPPAEDPLLHFLASMVLQDGKRKRASRLISRVLLYIHAYTRAPPLPILRAAIFAVAPALKTKSMKRTKTKTVQMPSVLNERQRISIGLRWILKASNGKPGKTLEERLARELIAVIQETSEALKMKTEVHRAAMINRGEVPKTRS